MARSILRSIDRGEKISACLRQAERLAVLMRDDFMKTYAERALQPARTGDLRQQDLSYVRQRRNDKASGIFCYLQDFQGDGDPIGAQLKAGGTIKYQWWVESVPEAENFVGSARKKMTYRAIEEDFTRSVERQEVVLDRVRNRTYRYAATVLHRLLFESVPEEVIAKTREKVDRALAKIAPPVLEKFAVAYEELNGTSAENWTNACLAVRRMLLSFADAVYPPKDGMVDGRKVGPDEYINRLWAYAKQKLRSESAMDAVRAELTDLGNRIDAIYRQSNKGVHAVVSRDEAERVIVRTYLLLADLL